MTAIEKAARLAARAFLHTASYTAIYHGMLESQREEELIWMFERNLELVDDRHLRYFFKDEAKSDLECFYMLIPSCEAAISLWKKISGGILKLIFRDGGLSVLQRLIEISDWMDAEIASCVKAGVEYLTLQRMVVSPESQGKGIGTKSLSLGIRDADSKCMPIVLSTQDERNVKFYSRLGFVEFKRKTFKDSKNPDISFMSIFMVREPKKLTLC